jgi:hypothetical protein
VAFNKFSEEFEVHHSGFTLPNCNIVPTR